MYTLLDLKRIKKNYLKSYMAVNSFLIHTHIIYVIYLYVVFIFYVFIHIYCYGLFLMCLFGYINIWVLILKENEIIIMINNCSKYDLLCDILFDLLILKIQPW